MIREVGYLWHSGCRVSDGIQYVSAVIVWIMGIVYVIDTGLALVNSYSPEEMARTLKDEYISKAAIKQRRGRAGRTQPGECYHLYTEEQYNRFNDYPIPDMQKSDLSNDMIDILRMDEIKNVGDLKKSLNDLISPPEEKFIKSGLMILYGLDIITSMDDDGIGTPLGQAISMFRGLKPTHAKSIISAYFNYCKNEVIDIVSAIIVMDGQMEKLFIKYYKPKPGDRIKYVFINNDTPKALLGDRVETPEFIIEHKLKTSDDDSVRKYRVEHAQYCDDIELWRHRHIQHKEMPVFVQFQQDQEIKRKGEGDLFIIYEDDGVHYSGAEDGEEAYSTGPDDDFNDRVDGLSRWGGRL